MRIIVPFKNIINLPGARVYESPNGTYGFLNFYYNKKLNLIF
jgi:hypothetical protein